MSRVDDAYEHLLQYGGGPLSATLIDALHGLASVNDAIWHSIGPPLVVADIDGVIEKLKALQVEVLAGDLRREP